MPSFQTIYRATVMLAVGAIVIKGWQLYGPSADQVKSAAVSAMDMAETAWKNWQKPGNAPPPADARGAAPSFPNASPQAPAMPPVTLAPSAPLLSPAPAENATANASSAPAAPMTANQVPATQPMEQVTRDPATIAERVPALLSRLEQLGAADPKVSPWGSSGRLYRCSCGAALANSPAFTQHFEAVATEPALAVEQVVAKVQAWQTAQRNVATLR